MSVITVLQAVPRKPLTKAISSLVTPEGNQEYKIGQYDIGISHFSGTEYPVASFDDLAKILNRLVKDKYSCAVRGVMKQGINKEHFRRRKTSNPIEGAIEEIDQNWVCLDVDSLPLAAVGGALSGAPAAVRDFLPSCFQRAACWWSYSPSQGYKQGSTVSLHMWFYLDEEISNEELKRYFNLFNLSFKELYGVERLVDLVMFDSIQIHYTAGPDLIGIEDVLPQRSGILPGEPCVKLTEDWIKIAGMETGAVEKYIQRIGDDKDGFHSPILSASAAWIKAYKFSENGNKEFKALIRDSVNRANSDGHTKEQIERYCSDAFLDNLLRTASEKGFDKNTINLDINAKMFFQNYIYVEGAHKFYDKDADMHIAIGAMDLLARKHIHGAQGSKTFHDSEGDTVKQVLNVPGKDAMSAVIYEGIKVYNKWRGRQATYVEGSSAAPWEDHIHYLCSHRDAETNLLLDYFAFIVANPGRKVKWAPIIGSEHQGTGKSIIKIPMRKIYGKGAVEIGTEDVRNAFNWYMESELIFVEEVYGPDNRIMVNNIKARLTENKVSINIKGLPQYEAPNFANFVMFTNHQAPFPMDPHDRRFLMLFSELEPKKTEYYDDLGKWLEENGNGVYSWATDRNLKGFNSDKAPLVTTEKSYVIESSGNPTFIKLKSAMEDLSWPLHHDIVYSRDLLYEINASQRWQMNPYSLSLKLKKLGMKNYGRIDVDGRKETAWVVRDWAKWGSVEPGKIKEYMNGKSIGSERDWNNAMNL
jgi:hypothetical protein